MSTMDRYDRVVSGIAGSSADADTEVRACTAVAAFSTSFACTRTLRGFGARLLTSPSRSHYHSEVVLRP